MFEFVLKKPPIVKSPQVDLIELYIKHAEALGIEHNIKRYTEYYGRDMVTNKPIAIRVREGSALDKKIKEFL